MERTSESRSAGAWMLVAIFGSAMAGCASLGPLAPPPALAPEVATAPSAGVPWTPPPGAVPAPAPAKPVEIPADLRDRVTRLTLDDVVDVALRNSPQTREAWFRARSAAAEIDIRRSSLAPEIDLALELQRAKVSGLGGTDAFQQTTYGPAVTLNYLLFDFGGRRADVESARQALFAADFLHNQAIQDVVLTVARAYYQYQGTKALLESERTTLKEVGTNLQAADERRRAGVATVTDVLQSRTVVAQTQLNIETLEGQLQAVRGGLAAAMGLPANLPYDVAPLPTDLQPTPTTEAVEALIERALAGRPDLAAVRAEALAAASDVARNRAETLPRISVQGSLNRPFYGGSATSPGQLYSGGLVLSYPLFDFGGRAARVRQAEADLEAARSRVDTAERQATLQVWTDYAEVRTAAQRIETSRTLLQSATESEQASSERYRAGVGSILDLLTAQSALASARAQEVQARADWLQALAQLAHDTGRLGPIAGIAGGAQGTEGPQAQQGRQGQP